LRKGTTLAIAMATGAAIDLPAVAVGAEAAGLAADGRSVVFEPQGSAAFNDDSMLQGTRCKAGAWPSWAQMPAKIRALMDFLIGQRERLAGAPDQDGMLR